ncbi:MAG: glycosyltransferase family 4 protein [bacterium]|nr:glycosyltransferase family 4 protein [bacterium]
MTEINQNHMEEVEPKKRVLFIITQSEMGGAQRFVLEIVSHLNKKEYDLLVAVGSDGGGEFLKQLDSIRVRYRIIDSLKRNINLVQDIKSVIEIRKLIKEFRPNILFLNSSKAGFIGSLATVFPSKITSLKVIYRIGGWSFNDPWPKWKKKFWLMLEKISAPWKNIIIVNNKQDLDQANLFSIKPHGRIYLIHNGIDVYKLEYLPKEEAKLKLFEKIARYSGKIFQAEIIIGTIANLYPTKDLPTLIKAAEYFKNNNSVVFIIIGEGSERVTLEKMIKEKGLEHKVLLLGQLPDAKKYLPAFDIFVLPSVKEGFPWALIEAMAAKLPIIATRVGAVPEIIENSKNGFMVEPSRPELIADKIKEILNNSHLGQELGIQAHQTILFKFPLEKMVRETESLL